MGDTGGPGFGLEFESGVMYTSLGRANPFESIAKSYGLPKDPTYGYTFRFGTGSDPIPWAQKLRVIVGPRP
jgi:hypothetical protein